MGLLFYRCYRDYIRHRIVPCKVWKDRKLYTFWASFFAFYLYYQILTWYQSRLIFFFSFWNFKPCLRLHIPLLLQIHLLLQILLLLQTIIMFSYCHLLHLILLACFHIRKQSLALRIFYIGNNFPWLQSKVTGFCPIPQIETQHQMNSQMKLWSLRVG